MGRGGPISVGGRGTGTVLPDIANCALAQDQRRVGARNTPERIADDHRVISGLVTRYRANVQARVGGAWNDGIIKLPLSEQGARALSANSEGDKATGGCRLAMRLLGH